MRRERVVLICAVILSLAAGVFSYQPLWSAISSFRPWSLGLDLVGGTQLIYRVDLERVAIQDRDLVLNGLRDIIERRVNLFGVSEPRVYLVRAEGEDRLLLELAGAKDVQSAIDEIGETPFLDFREVVYEADATSSLATFTGGEKTVSFTSTALNGRYVTGAQVAQDSVRLNPSVALQFNKEGARVFEELTARNVGKPIAVFLDDELLTMPVVNEAITGGKAQITGDFTFEEARALAERFNAGALPAPITLINQHTVSAELGEHSLSRTITAGLIGTAVVLGFMVLYYRKLGMFSALALIMYVALTLAVFKLVPVTLTLSGIAGFILSIGMAVDANILVFERTKEEIRRGLDLHKAIEEGFRRAWTSIRDSNISTIITAIVLYYFTSSFVRGFALTLLIGVLMSMFSAITITRSLLRVSLKKR